MTVEARECLAVPQRMKELAKEEGTAEFVVAKRAPKVEVAFHGELGEDAVNRRLWSSWGDICVAGDGRVYSGIGDHGNAVGGDARCFLYCWDPKSTTLEQVVDFNEVAPRQKGQPAWSKVHARIDEDTAGRIFVSCTLNAGSRAGQENYQWSNTFPGGQLYRYDPSTGRAEVFANLPPRRCTATSLLDRQRNIWWCNLEAGQGDALWGLDLQTKKTVCQTADGSVQFNRNFALLDDGTILFNGETGQLMRLSPDGCRITATKTNLGDSPGLRSSTRQAKDGWLYGTTHKTHQLFRYHPQKDRLQLLGPTWLTGEYTTVTVLSPDERFVYYLPGAHGKGHRYGTPVIQYEIATGRRKVLAFLADVLAERIAYVPGGTYGTKLSADGGTLYVNLNGHAADATRPEHMRPIGFGLCAFAAIHIPEGER